MLKALIKKQFYECFRTYFINTKTGKRRSNGQILAFFVFFAVLMASLAVVFYGLAVLLGSTLMESDFGWLCFALMGIISVCLGTFGSVFNTFSSLYLAKDNDLLLSMPIPPAKILISRMSLVFGLSQLYSGIVWLPALIYGAVSGWLTPIAILFCILQLPLIAAFVTVLTCALGWVVALISRKVKNKSLITVVISLVFFFGYYYICGNLMNYLQDLVAHAESVGSAMQTWGNLFYQLGRAAMGDGIAMLVFAIETLLCFAVCIYVLSASFLRIVTGKGTEKKAVYRQKTVKSASVKSALFRREWKHFLSSPTYMLNSALGTVILPVLAIVGLVKRGDLVEILSEISNMIPGISGLLPFAVLMGICSILSINAISTPSVSLEGKTLWIVRSLPVSGAQVLEAKLNLHMTLNVWPAIFTALVLGYCVQAEPVVMVLLAAFVWAFTAFTGAFGLILGLLHPNFTWTSETMPIKQSINTLLSMLVGWVTAVASCGLYYPARNLLSVPAYLAVAACVLAAVAFGMIHWLHTKGGKVFDKL